MEQPTQTQALTMQQKLALALQKVEQQEQQYVHRDNNETDISQLTDKQCEEMYRKVITGEMTFVGDLGKLYARLVAVSTGTSQDTATDQTSYFKQSVVSIHCDEYGQTLLELSRPKMPKFSESEDAVINYDAEVETKVVANMSTKYVQPENKRHAIIGNLMVSLAPHGLEGRQAAIVPKPVAEVMPYVGYHGLAFIQNRAKKMIEKDSELLHTVHNYSYDKLRTMWAGLQFPQQMGYRNADGKIYTKKIPNYFPLKVASNLLGRGVSLKDALSRQAELSRLVVGKKGYAAAAMPAFHALKLERVINTSINQIIDLSIPEGIRVINVIGATPETCYHLRNTMAGQKVLINRVTGKMLSFQDNIEIKDEKVVQIDATTLVSGNVIYGDDRHPTLIVDFTPPQSTEIAKKVVQYEADTQVAALEYAKRVSMYGKVQYQLYVGALDVINKVPIIPSANAYRGYFINRSYETPNYTPIEVVRIAITETRYRASFPYHLIPAVEFNYFTSKGTKKTFRHHMPKFDMRAIYFPDPNRVGDISTWEESLQELRDSAEPVTEDEMKQEKVDLTQDQLDLENL